MGGRGGGGVGGGLGGGSVVNIDADTSLAQKQT